MHRSSNRPRTWLASGTTACLLLLSSAIALGADVRRSDSASPDELWREGIALVDRGDFSQAHDTFRRIPDDGQLTAKVLKWLADYEGSQKSRKELDRAEFDKYVEYAKARIERKEYDRALDWALAAADCAEDRDAFIQTDWMQDLVNNSLAAAEKKRSEQDWRGAWNHYARLGDLYECELRYKKLEREVLTHLRLDNMFKEGSNWEERIEKVRWRDAKRALEYVGQYYVEVPDFKLIAQAGLEQVLLLADSKTAQEQFEGLGNESVRKEFTERIKVRLDQIQKAPELDRRDTVRYFRRVVEDINRETVQLPEELVVNELMRGALDPLDDFTTVIWPRESEEFDKHTRGNFVGVGISIVKNTATDEIEVVTPLEDAPAYYAGIKAGDIITHVNGDSLEGFSLSKVVETITGPEGSSVALSIRRGDEELTFDLKRKTIVIESVKGIKRDETDRWDHWIDKDNGIGYVRIGNFMRNTPEIFENTLSELQGDGLKGLVLDLRGNPGGLLDTAWRISKLFLERSENVVSTKGRNRSENQRLDARSNGAYAGLPMVVLVDESSASASEIVAGAVRDNHHGLVVGARTFGKFSVQNLIPLSHSKAKLKITTARYYLPSGVSLHREPGSKTWGVEPDIPVRLVRWERVNLWKMRRNADLLGPPKPEKPDEDEKTAKGDGDEKEGSQAEDTATDKAKTADAAGTSKDGEEAAKPGKTPDVANGDESAKTADADESKEDELPPLDQPDENNRPMEDAQLDTALLVMRVKLLGELHPTLATAGTEPAGTPRSP